MLNIEIDLDGPPPSAEFVAEHGTEDSPTSVYPTRKFSLLLGAQTQLVAPQMRGAETCVFSELILSQVRNSSRNGWFLANSAILFALHKDPEAFKLVEPPRESRTRFIFCPDAVFSRKTTVAVKKKKGDQDFLGTGEDEYRQVVIVNKKIFYLCWTVGKKPVLHYGTLPIERTTISGKLEHLSAFDENCLFLMVKL